MLKGTMAADMNRALIEALRACRGKLIELSQTVGDRSVPRPANVNPADNAQMVDGLTRVMVATLEGHDEAREIFVETLFPGVIQSIPNPASLIESTARFGVLSSIAVVPQVAAEHRDEAARWLADFHAWMTGAVARIVRETVKA